MTMAGIFNQFYSQRIVKRSLVIDNYDWQPIDYYNLYQGLHAYSRCM